MITLGPLAIAIVYLGRALDWPYLYLETQVKTTQEFIAMPLVGIALLLFFITALSSGKLIAWLLALLSANFLWREWNQLGARHGVYVIIALIAFIWIKKYKDIVADFNRPGIGVAIISSGWTYFFSQLISKRIFKAQLGLPGLLDEAILHVQFEELSETVAHISLIIVALRLYFALKNANAPQLNPS